MKKYHVYGIGNALLDRNAQVNDSFLIQHGIEKDVMTLIDEKRYQQLMQVLDSSFCHNGCGGSAANTLIALRQFGGRGFYSCKVAHDEAGQLFLQELATLGVDCNAKMLSLPAGVTGQCLVLVNSDGQRTMNTHLGISESLDSEALDETAIADSQYLYLEGYLATSPTAHKALLTARKIAQSTNTKVALTLSDANIVRYFKNELLTLIGPQIDLLFCNEEEALLFTHADSLERAIALLQPLAKCLIVTCGSKGAVLAIDNEVIAIPTTAISSPLDTVGAGDLFAGAYLYGVTHGYAPILAIELANKAATAVVKQYGARLSQDVVLAIKQDFVANHYSFGQRMSQELSKKMELAGE